jgi:hypothetical protein
MNTQAGHMGISLDRIMNLYNKKTNCRCRCCERSSLWLLMSGSY